MYKVMIRSKNRGRQITSGDFVVIKASRTSSKFLTLKGEIQNSGETAVFSLRDGDYRHYRSRLKDAGFEEVRAPHLVDTFESIFPKVLDGVRWSEPRCMGASGSGFHSVEKNYLGSGWYGYIEQKMIPGNAIKKPVAVWNYHISYAGGTSPSRFMDNSVTRQGIDTWYKSYKKKQHVFFFNADMRRVGRRAVRYGGVGGGSAAAQYFFGKGEDSDKKGGDE